jgi:Tol biopolymer transport system component
MKLNKSWIVIVLIGAAVCAALAFQNSEPYKVLFEKARFTMETKGDLENAIELFDEIIKKYPNARDYAAKSLYLMGTCYEKLGKQQAQQARAAFQRVVSDYPEQTEEVRLANERLLASHSDRIIVREARTDYTRRSDYTEGMPSPDGRYFSFIDWDADGNLGIRDLTTGQKKMLTSNPKASKDYALWSAFSPDSTKIAYDWFRAEEDTCELHILDLSKGSSRTLLGNDAGFYREGVSWSHDQKHIATVIMGEHGNKIGWVSTKDGATRVLTTLGASMPGGPNNLFPSPDDRYVAYSYTSRKDPSNFDIFLVSTNGSGNVIPLVEHPANDRVLGWIPGKDELLFLSDRSGSWDVWMLPVKNGQPADNLVRIYPNLGDISPVGFTNDGSYYFVVYSRWRENYFSDFDPKTGKLIGSLTQPFSGYKDGLDWAPDDRRIAYAEIESTPEGPGFFNGSLHVRNLDSGEDRKISCGIGVVGARWAPDGKSLLVRGSSERKVVDNRIKTELYLVDPHTGETRLVAERPDSTIVIGEWSADAKRIYFVYKDAIFAHDLETGCEKKLLTAPRLTGFLARSPDGVLLAASVNNKENSNGLITVNVSKGEADKAENLAHSLSPSIGHVNGWFDWSADSRYLFYLEWEPKGGTNLFRVPRQGGTPEKLWHTDKTIRDLRIRPDGKQLTFGELRHEESLWVMEGLLSEP